METEWAVSPQDKAKQFIKSDAVAATFVRIIHLWWLLLL
jgi:hypothetical protein